MSQLQTLEKDGSPSQGTFNTLCVETSGMNSTLNVKDRHLLKRKKSELGEISLIKLAIVSAVEDLQDVKCLSKTIEEFSDLTPNHVDIMSTVASHTDIRGRRCAVCETYPREETIINRILLEVKRIRNIMLLVED